MGQICWSEMAPIIESRFCRGETIISHDDMPFPIDEDEQTVHVEAGQTVYFECVIGLTLIFEEADDQERAARTVRRLQPLN